VVFDRRWCWPFIVLSAGCGAVAAVLVGLAMENPSAYLGAVPGASAECLGLLNLFLQGEPLESSDVPLLVGALVALLLCGLIYRAAAARR
jgi:hypothetical protein